VAAPYGFIEFDQGSALLMTINYFSGTENTGIVNLATGNLAWLEKSAFTEIAYE
jgi:hypothetical protein